MNVQPELRGTVVHTDSISDSLAQYQTLYVEKFERITRESSALMPSVW
jgi:hypothetical protein